MAFRCGVVAVVGKPNVGKSTLMNTIVGEKVAIVSSKPQTTRKPIIGIANRKGSQLVFHDTPGIHQPNSPLGKALVDAAVQALDQCDAVLFVVDVSRSPDSEDERIARLLKDRKIRNVVVALNKMDRLRPEHVVSNFDAYEAMLEGAETMYTNAMTGENVDKLLELLVQALPEASPIYDDPDYYTSQTVRELASELIREKALQHTKEEVPHGIAVRIDSWAEADPAAAKPLTRIEATIFVERKSQKPILIGHEGKMLKKIGSLARAEIEKLLGTKVYLGLFVKVREGWRQNPGDWREVGLLG
jgi:GTP-binding protein Era